MVSDSDLARLCSHFVVSAREFESRWGKRHSGKLFIRSAQGACVFYRKGTGCLVHVAKPDICRAWPYFRGNLVDGESHALAKDFCPGIPQEQTHKDFVDQGIAYLLRENLAGSSQPDEASALQVSDLLEDLAPESGKG